jgi:hypothetical protein
MFAQFQLRYPAGSLISELVTIDHGKYVVRALVQVEGVTRATGLAAADTIELAEDKARMRALEVLGISATPSAASDFQPFQPPTPPTPRQSAASPVTESVFSQDPFHAAKLSRISTDTSWLEDTSSPAPEESTPAAIPASFTSVPAESSANWKRNAFEESPSVASVATLEEDYEATSSFGKVTPIGSRRHDREPFEPKPAETSEPAFEETATSSPVDRSSEIARIGVEIKRLGWNNKQGSDYLQRTYGKKTRHELSDEQLLSFLQYLESQPSPTS